MTIGWVDYSKKERNKVLSILDLLSEKGTLDELGFAPVRDGFSELFFPGTTTIQTRAKYFFIVPYAFKDQEKKAISPDEVLMRVDNTEKECAKALLDTVDWKEGHGIIGRLSLQQGIWLKRPPSQIYWTGLSSFGIFKKALSINDYVRSNCKMRSARAALKKLGNRNDEADGDICDDSDAGDLAFTDYWNLPTYRYDWQNGLNISLRNDEAKFLRDQIIKTHPDSMFAFILKENDPDLVEPESFLQLEREIMRFPDEMRKNYYLARDFSVFVHVLQTVYNIVISNGKNEDANNEWDNVQDRLGDIAELDVDIVFDLLDIGKDTLYHFLLNAKDAMKGRDLDRLEQLVTEREKRLKGSARARCCHPGEFKDAWYGVSFLEYRYNNAKRIINDIFEGLE